ncbi:MAG: hypothetical protein ACRC67_24330 [Inquilinus sp.]|uniref:hypothetical protein n=1 Tax=Inquilinus sp. TaxID=1932117 RepID=UPI003F3576ED
MIFHFSPTEKEISAIPVQNLNVLISDMFNATRKGWHLVIISRSTTEWLLENVELDMAQRVFIREVHQSATQYGNMIHNSSVYIRISMSDSLKAEKYLIKGNEILIHIDKILSSRILDRTILLTEDVENDPSFYKIIFDYLSRKLSFPRYDYETHGGGGNRISSAYKILVNDRRNVVCIYDSDRYSPGFGRNKAEEKLLTLYNSSQYFVGTLKSTIGRELENYIPLSILSDLHGCSENPDKSIIINAYEAQKNEDPKNCIWLFFDIKKGFNVQSMIDSGVSEESINWYMEKFRDHMPKDSKSVTVFGERTINTFLSDQNSQEEFRRSLRTTEWKSRYMEKFNEIVWYLVAAPRKSTY